MHSIKDLNDDKNPCIGPCYPSGQRFLHPITLEYISNDDTKPFCPIKPTINKKGFPTLIKECKKSFVKKDFEDAFLTPNINFNSMDFLKELYKITSLDEAVIWYNDNPTVPYNTIQRIMDCALLSYGQYELLEKGISDLIIEFTKFMVLNYWYDEYFVILTPRMDIFTHKDGSIDLQPLEINSSQNVYNEKQKQQVKEKVEKLLTNLFLSNILKKYALYYKDKWNEILKHLLKLKKWTYICVEKKLFKKK